MIEFVPNPFRAHRANQTAVLNHGREGFSCDLEVELRGETHRPQQAQVVFGKALVGVPNRAQDLGLQVGLAAHPIENFIVAWVVKQGVDREVSAQRICFGISKRNSARVAAVFVIPFRSEGGNLELTALFNDKHHPELFAHRNGMLK